MYFFVRDRQSLSGLDDLPVPVERILREPLAGGEIHIDQTETVAVAAVPFQIVGQ